MGEGVWRLKTADTRTVGWFPAQCVFVAVEMDLKINCDNVRDNQMYQNTLQFRKTIGLLGGAYINGGIDDCIRV